ncbi:MAG TPA: SRPBCC domain-containing protein [Candidatus Limnocylindrales bacterium]|nr:SRPBCC domain-containing protein [Candidatus Limnocylindrales bacterium]
METTSERADGAMVERPSDRELVIARTINGPARLAFEAWTNRELFERWWVPRSIPAMRLVSCELDVRVGGGYRLEFDYEGSSFAFFGRYLEVTPPTRLVWTNDEDGGETVTTVTFEETDGRTLVTVHDRYPSKEALDEAVASGSTSGMPEQLAQLDDLVGSLR